MQTERFRELFDNALTSMDSSITMDTYQVPSVEQPVVRTADGTAFYLTIVHTGRSKEPDKVIERTPDDPIQVVSRQ